MDSNNIILSTIPTYYLADFEDNRIFEVTDVNVYTDIDGQDVSALSFSSTNNEKKTVKGKLIVHDALAHQVRGNCPAILIYFGASITTEGELFFRTKLIPSHQITGKISTKAAKMRALGLVGISGREFAEDISSFPIGSVFTCWDFETEKIDKQKVLTAKYSNTKLSSSGYLEIPFKYSSQVQPDRYYVLQYYGVNSSKGKHEESIVDVIKCSEDILIWHQPETQDHNNNTNQQQSDIVTQTIHNFDSSTVYHEF